MKNVPNYALLRCKFLGLKIRRCCSFFEKYHVWTMFRHEHYADKSRPVKRKIRNCNPVEWQIVRWLNGRWENADASMEIGSYWWRGGRGGRGGYMELEGSPQPWKGEGMSIKRERKGCPSEWRAALKSMSALCDLWQDYYFAVNNFASAAVFVAHPSRISKEGEIVPRLSTTSHYWQGF